MRILILVPLLLFLTSISYSQINVSGKVITQTGKSPIPYANIGILNTEIGTISNEDGSFSLTIPQNFKGERLLFSAIGFHQKSLLVNSDTNQIQVLLQEKITELRPVEIIAHRSKNKIQELGNGASLLLSGQLHFDSAYAGSAMALLIDRSEYTNLNFINQAALYIAKNLSPSFKVRMRIMSVDSMTNKPGKDLLPSGKIITSEKRRGWINFKLDESLFINENQFFVVFEWILTHKDRLYITQAYKEYMETYPERVYYDTVIVNNKKVVTPKINKVLAGTIFGVTHSKKDINNQTCYFRQNSFGEWKTSSGILSAKVSLSEFPVKQETLPKKVPCQTLNCQISEWTKAFKDKYDIEGIQLSVMKDDSLLFSEAYGYADKELKKEVLSQTQFRIASVSKTMTAVAIMQLHEKGFIDLDAPIQQYVPQFPRKKHLITTRQLLGHLGGIKDYDEKSWNEIFIQKQYEQLNDALELFKDDTLAVKPESKFHYSSYGYILLGAAIENITQQPYLKYMKKNLWDPLKLNATYGDVFDSTMVNKSKFYFINGKESTPYNLSYLYPSGGLISTTNDLVYFGNALIGKEFLDSLQKAKMFKTQRIKNGQGTGYGLGWYISKDNFNFPIYYHAGELPSSSAFILISPTEKISIALLTNTPIVTNTEDELLLEILELKKKLKTLTNIGLN